MAKASEMAAAVASITLSPDHNQADVLAILNRGLQEIAGGGDRAHGSVVIPPLPDLFTTDEVTVSLGDDYAEMPDDYQRGLEEVVYDGNVLKRYKSWKAFRNAYRDSTGDPTGYCLRGRNLWIGPTQSASVDVDVFYHRVPETMAISAAVTGPPAVAAADDVPEGIPLHLHHKLLVNYAAKEIFSDIEQGLEGKSPDTIKYTALYQAALTDLERFIGPEDGEPECVADEFYTDDNII